MSYPSGMDTYTKGFIVASLAYFVAAAGLGIWMGADTAPDWAWFGHIHFNLLGFMAMMIYGVGYFILPRFNARPLVWPGAVAIHFFLANVGLIGMVVTAPSRPSSAFLIFSLVSLLSVVLFAVNLGATIILPAPPATAEPEEPDHVVTSEMRIGEIISRWPATVEVFVKNGFAPLANPAHQEKVKSLPVTLAMGCANHQVDLEKITSLLNAVVSGGASPAGTPEMPSRAIGPDDVIGEVLRTYPATEDIFRRYYGEACFSCPGQATETVRQSTMMHNADEKKLLAELNEASRSGD
jgi:hypothetical protein